LTAFKNFIPSFGPRKIANLKVAALCFIAAATFWLLNALNKDNYITVVDYPIEIIYDEDQYMAVAEVPSKINIEINGNGWDLLRKYFHIQETPFVIQINNPSTKKYILGTEISRELAENISPTNLMVVLTDTIKFEIDKIISKKVIVKTDTTANTLAKNFRMITGIMVEPNTISVKGPSSLIDQLNGVIPLSIPEEKINQNYEKNLNLRLPKDLAPFLTLETETVNVKFDVIQLLEGNKRVKLKLINFPKNVSILDEPSAIIMNYLVDERKVEELKNIEFEALINYNNRNKEDSTVSFQITPKATFLENIKVEPELLKLKYAKP
jgi:YbbR domain-containing protein